MSNKTVFCPFRNFCMRAFGIVNTYCENSDYVFCTILHDLEEAFARENIKKIDAIMEDSD